MNSCKVMFFFDSVKNRSVVCGVEVEGRVLTGMPLTVSKSGHLVEAVSSDLIVGVALSDASVYGCLSVYDEKRWRGK